MHQMSLFWKSSDGLKVLKRYKGSLCHFLFTFLLRQLVKGKFNFQFRQSPILLLIMLLLPEDVGKRPSLRIFKILVPSFPILPFNLFFGFIVDCRFDYPRSWSRSCTGFPASDLKFFSELNKNFRSDIQISL